MGKIDFLIVYPESFRHFDRKSIRTQRLFFGLNSILLIASVVGAFCTTFHFSGASFIAYFVAFIIFLILNRCNLEKKWFNSRSIAESLKTISWRYLMVSDPFDNLDEKSKNDFIFYVKELLDEDQIIQKIEEWISSSIIKEIRKLNIVPRKEVYLYQRIEEQLKWYRNKKKLNHRLYLFYWVLGLILQIIALWLAYNNWANRSLNYELPIESLIVASNAVFAWTQLKRNRELMVAYSIASQEIETLKKGIGDIHTDEEFSLFVKNSEAAFSREHTRWFARI